MNDLALGAFSDDGPWEVDVDRLSWLPGLDHVRRAVRAEVPALVRPRRVPPGGRLAATARHLGVGVAVWAAGKRRKAGTPEGRTESVADLSRRLRRAAERLGPAYIKLGQIISAGEGVFPEPLVAEFKKCRDQVPPETWATVRRVVEEDLGRPLESVFARFDPEPLAAASIAQVHGARLQSGEEVVVKVQRPQVARLVREDLAVMAWVAPRLVGRIPVAALANPPALVELFAETIAEELDFRLEAENMLDVARSLVELGQKAYVVPRPHPDLVAVIADLGLDRPPVDPTTLTPDELVAEIQRTVKGLLGYGARMPKELMLFVKNLVFLDGAIANLAPDLDLFAEIAHIATHFAVNHGARITADVGVDPRTQVLDLSGVKASFGVDSGLETLTYRELQERRAVIREGLAKRDRRRRRPS